LSSYKDGNTIIMIRSQRIIQR